MNRLDTLPVELFHTIAQQLGGTDLGSFRQSSQRLCAVLTPSFKKLYFKDRTVALSYKSLVTLRHVLESDLGNSLQDLAIKGGLIDGSDIRNQYSYQQDHEWGSLEHRILQGLESLGEGGGPPLGYLLTEAFHKLPSRRLRSLQIGAPTAASLAFSTLEVRRAICWKTFTTVLGALGRSGVSVQSLKATGFAYPQNHQLRLHDGLKTAFGQTTDLELDFAASHNWHDAEWLGQLLRCFPNLKSASLCMSTPTIHGEEDLFGSVVSDGLHKDPMAKLVLGRGLASYHMMSRYLEDRELNKRSDDIGIQTQSEQLLASLRKQPAMKMESMELRDGKNMVVNMRHGNCCKLTFGASDPQRDFDTFHRHVETSAEAAEAGLFPHLWF